MRYFRDKNEVAEEDPLSTEDLEKLAEDISELQSLIEQVEKDNYEQQYISAMKSKKYPDNQITIDSENES